MGINSGVLLVRTQQKFLTNVAVVLVVLAGISGSNEALGQVTRPLTQEGKKALYQRVIAVPGAVINKEMGGSAAEGLPITPFSVLYVYARKALDGRDWLQVGGDSDGTTLGWLPAEHGIDWKQTLTVGFRDPANQPRVLLFRDRDSLKNLIDKGDVDTYRRLRELAAEGNAENSPVAAIQPEGYIDIRKDFYLVPILNHEDVLVGPNQARLLHVASVPLRDAGPTTGAYRAGIVFVIDTTISMGPYIERTRSTMRRVYDAIEAADLSDKVSYGLVAYRDNTKAVPGLEFTSRIYANLTEGSSGAAFLDRIRSVRPASVSSEGFNEDAYAGIQEAIQAIDWSGYFARYVILVTDAGPRLAGDALSTTGLDTESLRRLARDKDIALWVMHLKTPAGNENHGYAEGEYRRLSTVSGIGEFYYPVATGDVDSFERALAAMTQQLSGQVRDAAQGRPPMQRVETKAAPGTELAAFQDKVARLGYALRLRYLQEAEGQAVPALFDAWMVDRDLDDPADRAVDVRVLLTRDQLSDLHEVLRKVLITAEEGALAPQDFLDELKSLAATISRDPEAAKTATRAVGGESLADLGYMREYIEGLPYQSEVMTLDLGQWQQWSAQRQFDFINKLDGKVAYYRAMHDNVDLWVSLDGGPIDGDSVYPLLLEALP